MGVECALINAAATIDSQKILVIPIEILQVNIPGNGVMRKNFLTGFGPSMGTLLTICPVLERHWRIWLFWDSWTWSIQRRFSQHPPPGPHPRLASSRRVTPPVIPLLTICPVDHVYLWSRFNGPRGVGQFSLEQSVLIFEQASDFWNRCTTSL